MSNYRPRNAHVYTVKEQTCSVSALYYITLQELGFDVESLLSDIYQHFNNSTTRKQTLVEFCDFVETEYKVLLKHVKTRWLSLNRVIERTLAMYKPLKSYFASTGIKNQQVVLIFSPTP